MSHDHDRAGAVCSSCAKVGRHEALTEARDLAAREVGDMRALLARGRGPIESWTRERLQLALKLMRAIEGLENAPAPLPEAETEPVTSETNVVPIGRARRGGPKRRK